MNKSYLIIILLLSILITGCNLDKKFFLENEYYDKSEFMEIDAKVYTNKIENNESFILFIYQPMCATSANFEKIVKEFLDEYKISINKIAFSNIANTDLSNVIKYYPSFVIIKDGKIIDYLDANSDEDTVYYKNKDDFSNWILEYIKLK